MDIFPHEDFLLESEVAKHLYHDVAKDLPIVDYHCHLSPELIAEDHRFRSITEIWLEGDHYKWRAMRASGVDERFCTGDASDFGKFEAWARTVPATICNPLFHWTAMELARPFGIKTPLNPSTAKEIFDTCNAQLCGDDLTTQGILRKFRVAVVCTTDDPADTLEAHKKLAVRKDPDTCVYPTWRPDRLLAVSDAASWNSYIDRLGALAETSITSWSALLSAIEARHSAFHELGCRASDHGLEQMEAEPFTDAEASACFDKLRAGKSLEPGEARLLRSALLYRMALLDHSRGWAQQFHLGALRSTNTRMRNLLGADTGFDSIGDFDQARPLAAFLDRLDSTDQLAKTIIYNVNPSDNAVFATMIGNYQDARIPGKMQWGSAWWFLDQLDGMEAQMRMLANMGLLSNLVGMVTDSRSFLSYPRHDYFRRLLCRIIGGDVTRGLLPNDKALLGTLVANICYHNACSYFGFKLGKAAR